MGTPLYNTDIIPLTSRPTLTVMDDGDYFVILDTSTGKISKILKTNIMTALKITYDNTTSGLTAETVQAALDELVVNLGSSDDAILALSGRLDTLEGTGEGSVAKAIDDALEQIETDKTLAVSGMAADAKVTGDKVGELKSAIGNYIYSATASGDWVHIALSASMESGTNLLIMPITNDDVDYAEVRGINSNNSDVDIADLTVGEWSAISLTQAYTSVEVIYKLTAIHIGDVYKVACFTVSNDWSLESALAYTSGSGKKNSIDIANIIIENNTPFVDAVPVGMRGIVAFEMIGTQSIPVSTIAKYRVSAFYYKQSGFYLYIAVQRYVNGSWSFFDEVNIALANAPTETELMYFTSEYGAFRVAVITSLLASATLGGATYELKPVSAQPFLTDMQNQVNTLTRELQYPDYEDQDTIKHVIHVDLNGNGDYTSIAAAYAAITDSSFENQYEVILHDGTYAEYNLICPPYTHTHGYDWKTCIVTSEGITSTLPVFDQRSYPSKLSNMTIISGTGYCIHNDYNFLQTGAVCNENLYCKKVYSSDPSNFAWKSFGNASIIGAGAQYKGVKVIYNNCTFQDGAVVCHSNSAETEEGNFHLIFKNCKAVNAYIQLNMAGNSGAAERGMWVCEIDGFNVPVGCPALVTRIGPRVGSETWFGWQIIGGNNQNFAVVLDNAVDPLTTDVPWDKVQTNEKVFVRASASITKGQWVTDAFAPCSANESRHNIFGVALSDASSGDIIPVWVGCAYSYTSANGEYGIGSNGELDSSATEKIGKVVSNIFYRYC